MIFAIINAVKILFQNRHLGPSLNIVIPAKAEIQELVII